MMLLRGRLVYFGPSGAPAVDYIRALPVIAASPYQANLSDVVSAGARAHARCARLLH